MGMFGNLGICKDCKAKMVPLTNGRCAQCYKFNLAVELASTKIAQHPDLIALDAHLEEWYA